MKDKGRQMRGEERSRRTTAGIEKAKARGVKFGAKNPVRGEAHVLHKLTEVDVKGLRRRVIRGESCRSVARDYGVCHTTAERIIKGQSWRHVALESE
jgi:DNA invertase Pin-like site-specific DNA recombinase